MPFLIVTVENNSKRLNLALSGSRACSASAIVCLALNIGDDFEFYQGATLGANTGLRGYINERFTGKSAFVQSTDIRWNFMSLKTGLLPISFGVYGGADYGRVWIDNNLVFDAAFNKNDWNTAYGGGFFVNMAGMMTANISAFNSDDGLRLAFKMGFGF